MCHIALHACTCTIVFIVSCLHVDGSINHSSTISGSTDDECSSISVDIPQVPMESLSKLPYVIVGDNLDKTIKPRHMTSDHQTQSIHYFNLFAVQDRIDFRSLSNTEAIGDVSQIPISSFLLNVKEADAYATIMPHILVESLHQSLHTSISCLRDVFLVTYLMNIVRKWNVCQI